MNSMKGTNSVHSERIFKKWISENKQLESFLAKSEGQKISSCKGTNTFWIKKLAKKIPDFTTKRVMVVNKGTRRIIIEN